MNHEHILDALHHAWATEISPTVPVNACILATRIGIEALAYFEIEAEPIATEVLAANAAAVKMLEQGIPTESWPDDAWSVGTHHKVVGPGYSGHVVLGVGRDLVDLTSDQFSRPAHNLIVPSGIAVVDGAVTLAARGTVSFLFAEGGGVRYDLLLDDRSYRQSRDWRNGRDHAGPVIRQMRSALAAKERTI